MTTDIRKKSSLPVLVQQLRLVGTRSAASPISAGQWAAVERVPATDQLGRVSLWMLGFVLLAGLGLSVVLFLRTGGAPAPDAQATAAQAQPQPVPQEEPPPSAVLPQSWTPEPNPKSKIQNPKSEAALNPQPAAAASAPSSPLPAFHTEPTEYTRQLVTGLTGLSQHTGSLSPEQAVEWKANLQQLIQQGAAGVGAIREFIHKGVDFDFAQT